MHAEPIIFTLGSATVLGPFALTDTTLVVELAQVDGGGEGILQQLAALLKRFAQRRKLKAAEWFVYAVHCANPNLKLRAVLERKGFTVWTPPGKGECCYLRVDL